MYQAIVFACLLSNSDQCLKLTDTWGLKASKYECEQRIEEMLVSTKKVLPNYFIVGAKCEAMGQRT